MSGGARQAGLERRAIRESEVRTSWAVCRPSASQILQLFTQLNVPGCLGRVYHNYGIRDEEPARPEAEPALAGRVSRLVSA